MSNARESLLKDFTKIAFSTELNKLTNKLATGEISSTMNGDIYKLSRIRNRRTRRRRRRRRR